MIGGNLSAPMTKEIYTPQPKTINTEGNTSKEIPYTRRTPTKYATASIQTQLRRQNEWSGRAGNIYATNLQLHTCTRHYAGPPFRDKPTALPNDRKGRVYNAQKATNKGNFNKSSRDGAPPRIAHQVVKSTTLGGPHNVMGKTAGGTEIPGMLYRPALKVLPARKDIQCSKAVLKGIPIPTCKNDISTGAVVLRSEGDKALSTPVGSGIEQVAGRKVPPGKRQSQTIGFGSRRVSTCEFKTSNRGQKLPCGHKSLYKIYTMPDFSTEGHPTTTRR